MLINATGRRKEKEGVTSRQPRKELRYKITGGDMREPDCEETWILTTEGSPVAAGYINGIIH